MKKTLIIHPKDPSTTFLDIVYKDVPNQTLITGGVTKSELNELIESHDRVLMMGHGSPSGLFAVGQFLLDTAPYSGYIIDQTTVPLLEKKEGNVFIWCNADRFVDTYKLKGFYTGMFISEVGEAIYCGLPGTQQEEVDESNYGFCEIISKYINEDTENIHENVTKEYGVIADENPVALYNHNRLYKA
jgi:hypothetical protein